MKESQISAQAKKYRTSFHYIELASLSRHYFPWNKTSRWIGQM